LSDIYIKNKALDWVVVKMRTKNFDVGGSKHFIELRWDDLLQKFHELNLLFKLYFIVIIGEWERFDQLTTRPDTYMQPIQSLLFILKRK